MCSPHRPARTTAEPFTPLRRLVSSGSPLEPAIGFSRAVRVDHHVFVAATAAIWPDGTVETNVSAQARRCLQIIERALLESGASLEDVVRTRVFLVDRGDAEAVAEVHGEAFGAIRPACGFIVISGFVDPRWRVEIEADAIVGSARPPEARESLSPEPVGIDQLPREQRARLGPIAPALVAQSREVSREPAKAATT